MPSFMSSHPPWRRVLVVAVLAPMMIVLAALSFAWPAARLAPRGLPVGVIGTPAAVEATAATLEHSQPGAFSVRGYSTETQARHAIIDRTVYGALESTPAGVTVLEASAASPSVAQLLTSVGQGIAGQTAGQADSDAPATVRIDDVVALSRSDPRGVVLSSVLLPISVCGVIVAMMISLLFGLRPAWRQVLALTAVASLAGLGAYLVAQCFLGALPHDPIGSWAALALLVLAMSSTVAGLVALTGARGIAIGAAVLVFVANPFSGASSAPQLLPGAVRDIGQWLPPGAGAELLRSSAYFGGHGAAQPLLVLLAWSVVGLAAVIAGHHTLSRFAAHQEHADQASSGRHERGPGMESVLELSAAFASNHS